MRALGLVLLVTGAACRGDSLDMPCRGAALRITFDSALAQAERPRAKAGMAEPPRLAERIHQLCIDDAWSSSITTCLTSVTGPAARCRDRMTVEERARLIRTTMPFLSSY